MIPLSKYTFPAAAVKAAIQSCGYEVIAAEEPFRERQAIITPKGWQEESGLVLKPYIFEVELIAGKEITPYQLEQETQRIAEALTQLPYQNVGVTRVYYTSNEAFIDSNNFIGKNLIVTLMVKPGENKNGE